MSNMYAYAYRVWRCTNTSQHPGGRDVDTMTNDDGTLTCEVCGNTYSTSGMSDDVAYLIDHDDE